MGVALRLRGQIVDLLLQVGELGLAHRLMELVLELGGHAAQLRHPLPERAQHGRELLRPDRDQRDDADEKKLAPTDVEHGSVNSERRATRSRAPALARSRRRRARVCARPPRGRRGASRAQPTLRVSVAAVGAGCC
jgi:hypothetical protein